MSRTTLCSGFTASLPALVAGSILVREGAGVLAFRGAAPPPGARELFQHIASVVRVTGLPLAWLETAGGRGGFFRGDVVAVGEADVRGLASAVLARLPVAWPRAALYPEVYATVVRVLLAHEIGHAVQARIGIKRCGPAAEREADLTAGWIAESLGWPERDDAAVMEVAGSSVPMGSHPSPSARVAAYRAGRRMRQRAAA